MINGFSDHIIMEIRGTYFVMKAVGAWIDNKFIERKEFTKELWNKLNSQHAKDFNKIMDIKERGKNG